MLCQKEMNGNIQYMYMVQSASFSLQHLTKKYFNHSFSLLHRTCALCAWNLYTLWRGWWQISLYFTRTASVASTAKRSWGEEMPLFLDHQEMSCMFNHPYRHNKLHWLGWNEPIFCTTNYHHRVLMESVSWKMLSPQNVAYALAEFTRTALILIFCDLCQWSWQLMNDYHMARFVFTDHWNSQNHTFIQSLQSYLINET